MYRVIVFAGTTEGNEVCRFLADHGVPVWACVATEYGSRSLEEGEFLHVSAERFSAEEMEELFLEEKPELVLDATHPYAAEVTKNIRRACRETGIFYQRVLREQGAHQEEAVYVGSTAEAVEYLKNTRGNILLTTGSKELESYTALPDYQNRLYARVLSLPSVLETCRNLGFEGRNLIGMQGPFSRELNIAMLRQYHCDYLVTKDTGKAGGFQEKIDAALECGVIPVIIGRPLSEEGISVCECKRFLMERFGFPAKPQVTLLGIGMGNRDTVTEEGLKAVEEAELLIGAGRMVDAVQNWFPKNRQKFSGAVLKEYRSEQIVEYIRKHPEYERVVILLSGDVGFYSGARKLLEQLGTETKVICGISSVVYFMAKIGQSWEDAKLASVHGRDTSLTGLFSLICRNPKVFSILGSKDAVASLAQKLVNYDMGDVLLSVGENLSYPEEHIFTKPSRELTGYQGAALSVVCALNPDPRPQNATHGICDEAFLRGSAPMTKEEVRAVSLAKLRLQQDSICYDVGAGTGSVAIEMALRAVQGKVYAVEKKEEAADLIEKNKRKFRTDNLEVVRGTAPQVLEQLPPPTHAFIGGSSGNLKQIMSVLLKKNPQVRMVINCITLETVTEALEAVREFQFKERQIVQVSVSRSKELGRYHMMMGENPIYIITCQSPESEI